MALIRFTGLPEDWHKFSKTVKARAFDVGGAIPKVADKRVAFYEGLFKETLPPFLKDYSGDRALVIHNDCDLYSSTLYVLTKTEQIAKPGTIDNHF